VASALRDAHAALSSALVTALLLACSGADEQPGDAAEDQRVSAAQAERVGAPAHAEFRRGPGDDSHIRAATDVLAFLRGEREFADIPAADTVVLYMAPEGGDARVHLPRARLADRQNWVLPGNGHSYALVPPARADSLALFPGAHARCWPQPLADRFPELATLPHVGAVLQPRAFDSCLQAWNLTFVFAADASPAEHTRAPRLVGVVYDQWEW
jgi:hypothetical protein